MTTAERREIAESFIEALTGDAGARCVFQVFDDSPAKRIDLAATVAGTLAQCWRRLEAAQRNGCGVYITINDTDDTGRRKAENVTGVRALFVEFDGGDTPAVPLYPAPSIVVHSVNGDHCYWLVDDVDLADFKPHQKQLIAAYRSDKSINNLDRVMRLPGFYHQKGDPVLLGAHEGTGETYDAADVLAVAANLPTTTWQAGADEAGAGAAGPPATDGDLRTLDVVALFRAAGLYRQQLDTNKHAVACPWEDKHSSVGGPDDTSTVVYSPSDGKWPAFKCFHSHCADRTIRHVVEHLGGDVVAAHCADAFVPEHDDERTFDRGDDVEVGLDLATRMGGRGAAVFDLGAAWRLVDPIWEPTPEMTLQRACHGYAGRSVRSPSRADPARTVPLKIGQRQIKGAVSVACAHLHRESFFDTAPMGAAFADQFARVDGADVVIEPLTRDHRMRATHLSPFGLPVGADPDDLPDVVSYLLADTWGGCDDRDERANYLIEWLGLALLGISTRYKDSPLIVGKKDTGKSQILNVIASVFPLASHRSVALHKMSEDYHRAFLSGGRINFVNELPARELLDSEAAKAILSGDRVNCRRPRFDPFDWIPRCAHAFACNELPPSLDRALVDRFVVLDCPNVVPAEKQDKRLKDKIDAAAPGIAWAALEGARRALARGHLIRPASSKRAGEVWAIESDPVCMWAKVSIVDDTTGKVASADLYKSYLRWCGLNGHREMSSTRFSRRLTALDFECRRSNGTKWMVRELNPIEQVAAASWSDWH